MMLVAEKRLQMAAHHLGLRVILDRQASRVTGQECYLMRPASDARCVVRILPDGNYCLAPFWTYSRRYVGTCLSLDEVEKFLARCKSTLAGPRECNSAKRAVKFVHATSAPNRQLLEVVRRT
jgi:hypothetical protein